MRTGNNVPIRLDLKGGIRKFSVRGPLYLFPEAIWGLQELVSENGHPMLVRTLICEDMVTRIEIDTTLPMGPDQEEYDALL